MHLYACVTDHTVVFFNVYSFLNYAVKNIDPHETEPIQRKHSFLSNIQ